MMLWKLVLIQIFIYSAILAVIASNVVEHHKADCVDTIPFTYNLTAGFVPTDFHNISEMRESMIEHKFQYFCDHQNMAWLNVHFTSEDSQHQHRMLKTFHARHFLHQISSKNLVVIGDSLARQLFVDMVSLLGHYETDFRCGTNMTRSTGEFAHRLRFDSGHRGTAYYSDFNATVSYCEDPHLESFYHDEARRCGNVTYSTDIWVIAVGPWFKPFFMPRPPDTKYYDHMHTMVNVLNTTFRSTRAMLKSRNPNNLIVWRLNSHVGLHDEWQFLPELFPDRDVPPGTGAGRYDDGLFWSNSSREGSWVKVYNEVTHQIASEFCDPILDAYTMSHKYLDFFPGSRLHVDGMHFCPGSIFFGELWLLQHLLRRHDHAHHHGHAHFGRY